MATLYKPNLMSMKSVNESKANKENTAKKKIRIAFVKYAGLSAGGTEKFLQTIAANLPKSRFSVDYYYCEATPYIGSSYKASPNDSFRKKYLEENGINLIKFNVGAKDVTTYTHDWVNTDFWKKFDEKDYDIIQTGIAGRPEYPFYKIRNTPIIDSIHLTAGVSNQFNVARVMHICQWNANKWIARGGDRNRVVLVSHPLQVSHNPRDNLRKQLRLEKKFVFGMHQRADDSIFSPIPLAAYKQIEADDEKNNKVDRTHFLFLGGSKLYREQAKQLGIKNITFIPHTGERKKIFQFLATLDVYAHGRKDGEVNSTALGEALYFGTPVVSHYSKTNNGHVECLAKAGLVAKTTEEYVDYLRLLLNNPAIYKKMRAQAYERFATLYELNSQMKNIISIYDDVLRNPFPNKSKRRRLDFVQRAVIIPLGNVAVKTIYFVDKYVLMKKL